MMMLGFLSVALLVVVAEPPRVEAARKDKIESVHALFAKAKVAYPPREIFLRSFKKERVVEVWAGNGESLALIKSYPVCASSGVLGPKRQQGDLQVPEGVYNVDKLNPWSSYHLALHVDYPNAADRHRSKGAGVKDLGGDIMVHGNCVTIGCILPARLDEKSLGAFLASDAPADSKELWTQLAPIYAAFEATHRIPTVRVTKGRYVWDP